jgi:hypothetical protein
MPSAVKRILAASLLTVGGLFVSQPARAQQAPPAAASLEQASAAFQRGVALHDGGKPAEAILEFERAIALGFQPMPQARFRLARALAKSGETDKALIQLEQLANNGFQNTAVLAMSDLDGLRALPRFQAVEKKINANAHPCASEPNFRAFDFWIGEWDVQPTGVARAPIGQGATSIVERQLDGCVIQENWLPPGGNGAGKSFNIFNTVTRQWEQYYVDTRGTITHYTGTFHDDGNLYYEATQFGSSNRIRMTFFNQGPNQVRQLGHLSIDGGKTWTVSFDLTYVRKPAT